MGNVVHSRILGEDPLQSLDFSSYEAVCMTDPDVQTFDHSLKDRTGRVLQAVAQTSSPVTTGAGAGAGAAGQVPRSNLPFDCLKEVTTSLLEMDRDVMEVILAYQEDVWKNQEILMLVREFFDNSLATLEFCTEAETCIQRAKDSQLTVEAALAIMPRDRDPTEGEARRILNLLDAYAQEGGGGEPFGGEFILKFRAVQERHALMLEKLRDKKKKLDRRLRHVRMWAKMSSILFGAAVAALLICSVVAAAIAAPPIAAALAAAASAIPLGTVGAWVRSVWKGYEDQIRAQLGVLQAMQVGTTVAVHELETIRHLVAHLQARLAAMVRRVGLATEQGPDDVAALRLVVEDLDARRLELVSELDNLQVHIERVGNRIRQARAIVLQTIARRTQRRQRPGSF